MSWVFQPLPLGGASSAGTPFSAAEVPSAPAAAPPRRRHDAAPYAQSLAFVHAPTAAVQPTLAAVLPEAPPSRRQVSAPYTQALAFVQAPAVVPLLAAVLPVVPQPRRVSVAAYALSLAFVPLLAAAPTEAAPALGGDIVRGSRQGQYQAVTAPVFVPSAGETVTLDKWKGTQPDHLAPRRVRPASSVVAPLHVPDVTQPVTALSWRSVAPELVRRARQGVGRDSAVEPIRVVEVPSAASWHPAPTVPPARRVVRPQGGTVAVPDPSALAIGPGLTWHHAPEAVASRPSLRPSTGSTGVVAPPTAPAIVPLDWYAPPTLGRMPQKAPRPVAALTGPVTVIPPAVVLGWTPAFPDAIGRPARTALIAAVNPVAPVAAATPPTSASPAQQGGAVLRGARVIQYQAVTGPVVVPPPAVVPPHDWHQAPSTPRRRVVRRPTGETASPVAVVAPAVPGMAWHPLQQGPPRRRIVRPVGGLVAPVYVPGVTVAVPAGLPWRPQYPDRVFPRRRAIERGWFGYPFIWPDAAVVVAVGNLWEDISATPGATPHGSPVADTGASPFTSVTPTNGASPFGVGAADTGTSPFGPPPSPSGKSPWDLP